MSYICTHPCTHAARQTKTVVKENKYTYIPIKATNKYTVCNLKSWIRKTEEIKKKKS